MNQDEREKRQALISNLQILRAVEILLHRLSDISCMNNQELIEPIIDLVINCYSNFNKLLGE